MVDEVGIKQRNLFIKTKSCGETKAETGLCFLYTQQEDKKMEPITINRTLELADMLYEAGEDYDRALEISFNVSIAMNDMIALGATDEQINEIIHNATNRNKPEKLLS